MTEFNIDAFEGRDINEVVKLFEMYLNNMFVADNAMGQYTVPIDTTQASNGDAMHSKFRQYEVDNG